MTTGENMRAVVITEFGDPDVLKLRDVSKPVPQRGEVRVKVKATGVNRADLSQRMGKYPAPSDCPQDILGLEYAGIIDAIGDGAGDWKIGDRVCGLVGGGSYAEYVVVHNRVVTKIPDHLNFVDAAALPEVFMTAYDAMVTQGGLMPGDTVLISAVGSGVGTAALQIVKALGGRAIGTSRTADKLDGAKQHGLHEGILVKDGKFAEEVMKLTDGRGVDIVLELVGGAYVEEDIRCMAPKGRLMMVGLVAGAHANLELGKLLTNRLDVRGTSMRKRPLEEKIEAANKFSRQVIPLVESGALKPIVAETFPLEEAAEAHRHVQADKNFGKVVLVVDAE